jgi:ceramide glucosyltransferase
LPTQLPPVTVFIPVKGVEGEGLPHFRRFCSLDWPNYQLIFTILDPHDPSLPILKQLQSNDKCQVYLQIGGSADGANLKIRNLLNAFPLLQHEWMIVCDADVEAEPGLIKSLMVPLINPSEVGLTHSVYRCKNEPSLAAAWENVWTNCDFWVQGLLGDWINGADFAFGAAMAFHRETLRSIGGWEGIKNHLADDFEIGNRIFKLGKTILFSQHVVTLAYFPISWNAAWNHLLRWSRTIRVCQPGGFAGSIILNMTFIALLGLLINPIGLWPMSLLLVVARVIMAHQCRNGILSSNGLWKNAWMIPVKDLSQLVLWVCAFGNGPIDWRGNKFKLKTDGTLIPYESDKIPNFVLPTPQEKL